LDQQNVFDADFNLFVTVFYKNIFTQQAILVHRVELYQLLHLVDGLVEPIKLDGLQ
jgi:hypothetical protein